MKAVKWLLAIVLTFSATQSIAESCKVYNSKQALTCLTSLANETHGEGELPNSIGITRQKAGFLAFKALLNESGITGSKKKKVLKTLKKAAYVATVMVHFDEDEIHYYAINRGKKVTPKK